MITNDRAFLLIYSFQKLKMEQYRGTSTAPLTHLASVPCIRAQECQRDWAHTYYLWNSKLICFLALSIYLWKCLQLTGLFCEVLSLSHIQVLFFLVFWVKMMLCCFMKFINASILWHQSWPMSYHFHKCLSCQASFSNTYIFNSSIGVYSSTCRECISYEKKLKTLFSSGHPFLGGDKPKHPRETLMPCSWRLSP